MSSTYWCAGCAGEAELAPFDCLDHGPDCLELACTGCGLGAELGAAQPAPADRRVAPAA